ncbi:biphenyl-2,3-diol 1,2-dioxygenase [Nocardia farcinica]|uniref:3-methylcatechol 2,3-dioxygenase n=1 Tax=Nocardia farcinica TaxID=37329 RepID=A0A0H5NGD7_NOCFR|nr:VOC family protein [Nocardia farcinica]AXK84283.1 biphenyl 2,3-dioxygenase [Nocardia farcinica]MBA4856216.1 VOC family protein [Nocardia farcinica]MBC9814037.1 VOC family protein [Nocardia farcinica]CRY74563.1 3-methylcatechol 2%2C3-dioxygenase [Nocardia farcinica]SIS56394.1 biphenyl-2,3-diol 1,2-dioxygenase [Nocardia farcinica]
MSGVKELAYVVYEASDLAAWRHFACDLLGMQLAEETTDALVLRTDERAFRWRIERGAADDLLVSGYEVDSDAALDRLVERLRAAGAPVAEGDAELAAARRVDRIVLTADPMGNHIELVTGFADAATPFHSAVLLGSFVTGTGGAGHHVLLARGVPRPEYMAFYEGVLGFRVSDTIVEELAPGVYADLIFLHCNPRHHSVAFGEMPHPKRIHHFMLEVDDIRDVGMAYDRCLDAAQPFEMTLGMHPNDNMFSFYVRTPSGFSIEYGWGGLLIDDATWQVRTLDRLHSWGHRAPEVVHELLGRAPSTNIRHEERAH